MMTVRYLLFLMATLLLASCASVTPAQRIDPPQTIILPQHPGALIAARQVGAPYRYGGASPRGFDCSGLVYYSFRKAGIHVPRTTRAQYRNAFRVSHSQLQPGDLVFFKASWRNVSHVGIYAGNNYFIHAPSRGKKVSFTSMNDPYWSSRYIGAGRYY